MCPGGRRRLPSCSSSGIGDAWYKWMGDLKVEQLKLKLAELEWELEQAKLQAGQASSSGQQPGMALSPGQWLEPPPPPAGPPSHAAWDWAPVPERASDSQNQERTGLPDSSTDTSLHQLPTQGLIMRESSYVGWGGGGGYARDPLFS